MSRQANVNWLISVFYRAVLSLPFACRSSSRDPGAAAPDRRAPTLCLISDRSYLWRIVCSGPGYLEHNPIGDRRSPWSNQRPSSLGGAYGSSTSRLIWASLVNSFSRIGSSSWRSSVHLQRLTVEPRLDWSERGSWSVTRSSVPVTLVMWPLPVVSSTRSM